jgi:hypothetical protein
MTVSAIRLRWLYLRGAFWWMTLASALIGVALLLIGILIRRWEHNFQQHAARAVATVTGKERGVEKQGNKSERVYYVLYNFPDAGGAQRRGKMRVSPEDWRRAKEGDTLEVEYDSTDPATSRRAGTQAHSEWGLWILGGIGGLFITFGLPLAAYAFVRAGRRARLVRHGAAALGAVDEVAENDSPVKVAGTYRVIYRFTDEGGQAWEGRGPPQPWSRVSRWEAGDTILVLYDLRDPRRNEPDVFDVRQADRARLQDQAAGDPG